MKRGVKVGLVELPMLKLIDPRGKNWTALRINEPLENQQVLAGTLFAAGYELKFFNLREGTQEIVFGEAEWRGMKLSKIALGNDGRNLDPKECDVWVVVVNTLREREMGFEVIKHLANGGGRVVAHGPDSADEPRVYIETGALVAVADMSAMSNKAAVEVALGKNPEGYYRLYTRNGYLQNPGHFFRLHPEDWPLPPAEFVKQLIGWKKGAGPRKPATLAGSVRWDHGCDRACDFCEIPPWKLGYQYMSPKRALEWLSLQKEAGAVSAMCFSDQFLGRILYENGRREVLDIMRGLREMGMPIIWDKGVEFAKATLGRGKRNGDPTPDEELVQALWGWDGQCGAAYSYLPAERPLEGPSAFPKLLSYENHKRMLKSVIKAGVPHVLYGIIIGYPDDSSEKMKRLFEAMRELREELLVLNPNLAIRMPARSPIPYSGTALTAKLKSGGHLRFNDPSLAGNTRTPVVSTDFMSYEEISEWQKIFWQAFVPKGTSPGMTTCYDD